MSPEQALQQELTSKEEIWLKQFCAGNESAYKIFFDEYYQILAHFAFKYVHDFNIAEDIVHDLILEIYSKKRCFDNLNKLKSFLYFSIKNRCLNHIEHENAKNNYLQTTDTNDEILLDSIIEEEIYFLINKAIKQLPNKLQSIYQLVLTGASNEEIAEKLSLSLDSVKAYKKRGKQILKEKLKGLTFFLSVPL